MNIRGREEEVENLARKLLKGVCRVCRICDGWACAGQMPGMGGIGSGSSFIANVEALASYKLNLRTIHSASRPDISFRLFGHELEMPILVAPVAGTKLNMAGALSEAELAEAMVGGAAAAGSFAMTGDGPDAEIFETGLAAIVAYEGRGVPIVKPRPKEQILAAIRKSEAVKAWAVGVDVDAAGILGMVRVGHPVGPRPVEEWEEVISSTSLPFILKGIMTPDEAELALEAGAGAIVVSNHGGRVLDHTPGTAEVLPEIVSAVAGEIPVLVDGGVRSGADALKMLALGASAVLVGRPMAIAAVGGGAEAVASLLKRYADELRSAMILTGRASLEEIDSSVLRA